MKERNYLNVFPYDKWSDKELPNFEEGEEFMPSVCELKEGETSRPSLLTEADLVTLMDKNGIGKSCLCVLYFAHEYSMINRDRRHHRDAYTNDH